MSISSLPRRPVPVDLALPLTLFVVVDTEEEFDWHAPLSRSNTSVRAMHAVDRLQRVVSPYAARPTYVIDYPVASQPDGWMPLKALADSGEAEIGAHLHPWVNPPFVETVNARNSFGCALEPHVEAEKIRLLRDQIGDAFGAWPTVYKAGRYGFGPTTAAALESLGFSIDVSINPRMDASSEGGPCFDAFDTSPFLFGHDATLLEIPCSTDFTGVCGRMAPAFHRAISRPLFRAVRTPGVVRRLGLVDKVMLSPEGSTLGEMKALTRSLLRRGIRTFSMTLHSPSLEPGHTPYVRTARDLFGFLDRISGYCEFFFAELGGVPSTPTEFLRRWVSPAQSPLALQENVAL
ncbi:MAG TPA: hypothetical protein VHZ73_07060 [Vicinamibacterales bacterium]|jgi:hypothetical protein|nr:hypothetical protein [Vicinamibacterales bacterium]